MAHDREAYLIACPGRRERHRSGDHQRCCRTSGVFAG